MPRYLIALYDDAGDFRDLPPDEMQQVVEKYGAWGRDLEERGHLIASDKLQQDGGRVMRRSGGRVLVLDGPFSESKEVLGGYFVLQAESYDQVVELTRTCPHLDYSGTVEIREIEEL